jgi:hypothetical protein
VTALECQVCGLAACDLPDGVDPEFIFEGGLCQVCVRPASGYQRHWLTLYDPADGSPYGELCDCAIGQDHDGEGNLNGLLEET